MMAVRMAAKVKQFAALPNRVANRDIVPELWGVLGPEDIAARCEELLDAPEISVEAKRIQAAEAMGPPGAAERFAAVAQGIAASKE